MPLDQDRDLASLLDVATAGQQIQRYCSGISRTQFEQDDEKQAAVLYRIGVIGEAVKQHWDLLLEMLLGVRQNLSHG